MEQSKIEAFKREFPTLKEYFINADSISVKKLDEAKLREKTFSPNPRDYRFNGAAGDSYSEIYRVIDGGNVIQDYDSILDNLIKYGNFNLTFVLEIHEKGGHGLPNSNEFGYGKTKNIVIWRKSKFDLSNFIEEEIKKYQLEIKREANF